MHENRYYKKRDVRAVENPYDAAFELTEEIHRFTKASRWKNNILAAILTYFF
jgi:hypothetical protein